MSFSLLCLRVVVSMTMSSASTAFMFGACYDPLPSHHEVCDYFQSEPDFSSLVASGKHIVQQ